MNNNDEVLDALKHIPCECMSCHDWLRIGMALHREGFSVDVWDAWSATDESISRSTGKPRYRPGECQKRWETFDEARAGGTSIRTIFAIAYSFGWENPASKSKITLAGFCCTEKDSRITRMLDGPKREPMDDLLMYLEAVFAPGDIVPYVVRSHDQNGKWAPGRARFAEYDELVDTLINCSTLEQVVGRTNPAAGAWIGFNPSDGAGQSAANIVSYRYVLIECDDISISKQLQQYLDLKLPIAALIHSGKRSLHAVMHVDADSLEQYCKRVAFIYAYLKGVGLPLDEANKNPNRWTRMPGAVRGDSRQWLVATDIGAYDYDEWAHEIAGLD